MGGVQSITSSEGAIAATATLVVAGAVGYGITTMSQQQSGRKDEGPSSGTGTGSRGKKKKKKQHNGVELDSSRLANEGGVTTTSTAAVAATTTEQAETVTVAPFPVPIPGDFDVASTAASISSKGKVKDKGKGKVKQSQQTAGDDGASSATPSESQHPTVLASGSKSKKSKKKRKSSGPASSSNLASSLIASSSKVSTDGGQSPSAAPDKDENHPIQSSVTAIGLESKGGKSKDSLKSAGSSSTEDEGAKKKSSTGTSTIGVGTTSGVVPAPVIVHPPHGYVSSHDTDSSWTHVQRGGSNSRSSHLVQSSTSGISTTEITTSDAGIGSSVTDDGYPSSHVAERIVDTEDEETQEGSGLASGYPRDTTNTQRRTLAERLLPKARKTGVEDMLETPDHPSLARVVRVRPLPGEQPASGFSWADYEDVHVDEGAGHDADGEDDGWGVVRSRRSKSDRLPTSAEANTAAPKSQMEKVSSGGVTKKQRQNAKKREASKAAKAEAEAQRLSALDKHKQQLEKSRTMEQISTHVGKAPSGGMKASVDNNGKLVWD